MGILGPSRHDLLRLEQRVQRLQATVVALAARQGLSPAEIQDLTLGGPEVTAEIRLLHQQGRTVEAIRVLRRRTGLSLLEAKNAVDRL